MDIIQFKEANCKNCYKCLRSCPVKAISVENNQAVILKEECILCANCIRNCPQDAKSVRSDIPIVKRFLNKKEKVYVSIAPSFSAAFKGVSAGKFIHALSLLGFSYVEETAQGAAEVSEFYTKLSVEKTMKNIITSSCPSVVTLVRTYYPELVGMLTPCVSPMIAHGKMLKEMYGKRIKLVFIGPCIAKKGEYIEKDLKNTVDAVLTFDELKILFEEANIEVKNLEVSDEVTFEHFPTIKSRFYPSPGGILKSMDKNSLGNYKFISVDGIERCIKILDLLKNDNSKEYFIEMSMCEGSCIGGSGMRSLNIDYLSARESLQSYVRKSNFISNSSIKHIKVDLKRNFKQTPLAYIMPDEETITNILMEIGKYTKYDELNCGTCGYPTCREKAIAVFHGKANPHMCLPYIRERAESISNIIINKTPNAVFALNKDLTIQEFNHAAITIFGLGKVDLTGKSILEVLDHEDFVNVKEQKRSIFNSKMVFEKYGVAVESSILFLEQQNMIVAIFRDITEVDNNQKVIFKMRSDAVQIANEVIDKQMRVVQEIASLLGETTAETKVALTQLKKLVLEEDG